MKFEYKHEIIPGNADLLVKRLNELGDEDWEVVHFHRIVTEGSLLNPSAMILLKRPKS